MCSFNAGLHHLTVSRDVFFKIKEVISILRAKMVRLHDLVKQSSRLTVDPSSPQHLATHGVIHLSQGSVNNFFIDPSLSSRSSRVEHLFLSKTPAF